MRYLTPADWAEFIKLDGSFDGRRFEELVQLLINRYFGTGWRITKVSWDGGRDLERTERAPGEPDWQPRQSWAECKLHRKPVSLKLLSGTLVMAVIGRPRRLLLFSYSPIIQNAQEHLAHFSDVTAIPINVVDDEVLEDLILASKDEVRHYFPRLPAPASGLDGGLKFVGRLTRDWDIDPARWSRGPSEEAEPARHQFALRSVLRLQVFVRNTHFRLSQRIRLELVGAVAPSDGFELFNGDRRIRELTVEPAGIAIEDFFVRSAQAGRAVPLPRIVATDLMHGQRHELTFGAVSIRPLLVPPLIGGRFLEAIELCREAVSFRTKPVFISVCGASGTGKSRLKSEFISVLLDQGFEIQTFDGTSQFWGGFDVFARRLLSALNRLPDFDGLFRDRTSVNSSGGSVDKPTLEDILYDSTVKATDHLADVLGFVRESLATRAVALVFDNVQYLDSVTLGFIEALITEHRQSASRIVCIFVFNTDYLPLNQRASALLDGLEQAQTDLPEQFLLHKLADLSPQEVDLFLNHMIAVDPTRKQDLFTVDHPETAALFRQRIQPRPLNVLQTVFFLADLGAVTRAGDNLYVADVDLLHSTLLQTPRSLKAILARRWSAVESRYPTLVDAIRVLTVLRHVRQDDVERLGVPVGDYELLMLLGIASAESDGTLCFFHEQLERWFVESFWPIDSVAAVRLCQRLEHAGVVDIYFNGYFLAATAGKRLSDDLVRRGSEKVLSGLSTDSGTSLFGKAVLEGLRLHPTAVEADLELQTVRLASLAASANGGVVERISVLGREVKRRRRRLDRYRNAATEFVWLLAEHASWHFGTQDDATALKLLNDGLDLLPALSFRDEREEGRARAYILNRLCVAHKSVGNRAGAIKLGEQGLALAKRWNDADLTFFGYVDLGYIHYDSVPASAALLANWQEAVAFHAAHCGRENARFPDRDACAELIHSKCRLLQGDYDGAGALIDAGIAYCSHSLDVYYGPRFVLLQVLLGLLRNESRPPITLLRELVNRAVDLSMRYAARRSYWKALHARAIVESVAGDVAASHRAYAEALAQLLRVTSASNEHLFRYFFEDFAIALRTYRADLPAAVHGVRDIAIKSRIMDVQALSDTAFDEFRHNYQPCSTFSTAGRNLFCP